MRRILSIIPLGLALGLSACSATTEPPATSELTVVSFNIRNGGRRMDEVYDRPLQRSVITALKPDLFAMQEVDRKTKRVGGADVPAEFADALGMELHYAKAMNYAGGEYGTATFSKFRVIASESIPMPFTGVEPRAASLMTVALQSGEELVFVSVHLSVEKAEARTDNIRRLVARLESETAPVIVTGDFNTNPASEAIALLERAGFRRCVPKGDARSMPADQPADAIDHVFLRDGDGVRLENVGTEVVNEPRASDHRPVVARLKIVRE